MDQEYKDALFAAAPYFIAAIGIAFIGFAIIEILTPSKPMNLTWNGIGMFLAIAAGIGWILHGTGFLLVRG